MPDITSPLTEQQLDELDGFLSGPRGKGAAIDATTARRLVAGIRGLQAALDQIWRLHMDSPMGPCPVCIDADAAAAGGDGLVPYPCPTARLAGATDCDPPHVRAAAEQPAAEACGKCRQPFDTTRLRTRRADRPDQAYCRACVDRCHDTESADHRCVICA